LEKTSNSPAVSYLLPTAARPNLTELKVVELELLKELSVIIINYNGAKFLTNCLTALVAEYGCKVREILVVDNASTDNSREQVQPFVEAGEVTWIETGANLVTAAVPTLALT
jgi:hypothetical protein